MIFNITCIVLSAIFLALSAISAVGEIVHIKNAKVRNALRRLKITLRELTFLWALVISVIFVRISLSLEDAYLSETIAVMLIFWAGYFILHCSLICSIAPSKKRKKRSAKLPEIKEVPSVGEVCETAVLPELNELTPAE